MATPVEVFANLSNSLLNGAHNNSTTTIAVTDGSVFPSTGIFRILIGDEIMKCTSRSGNNLTVVRGTEGTSAASHADQDVVTAVISRDAIPELMARFASDVRRNPLDDADFTQVNFSSTTFVTQDGKVVLASGATAVNIRRAMKSIPGATFDIIAQVWFNGVGTVACGGICIDDGTKIVTIALLGNNAIEIQKWTNQTTFSALYTNAMTLQTWQRYGKPVYLRITDNGSTRKSFISQDGNVWQEMHSVASNDFLTPTRYGVFLNTEGSGDDRILTVFDLSAV